MKKIIIMFTATLLASQLVQAQGTTYLSNITTTGAVGALYVGIDSWQAALFFTGTNIGGYVLNSIQLGFFSGSGNPNDYTAMIYSAISNTGTEPGSSLGSLNGSADPTTDGIYTYTSNLMLSPNTPYFIVFTAGTTVAEGNWQAGVNVYNPSGGWGVTQRGSIGFYQSSDGSSWSSILGGGIYPEFAINATPIPEPSIIFLIFIGSGVLFYVRKHNQQTKTH